jgi:hypothetical protein
MQSYESLYLAFDGIQLERSRALSDDSRGRNALQRYLHRRSGASARDGFARIQACREALDALDRKGWQRSFHQRMFHENFIRACARVFFKTEQQGAFARAHQTILDLNGWDNLSQEILISTPRRRAFQPAPSQSLSLSHASTPEEGRHMGHLGLPLTLTCRLPEMSLYFSGSCSPGA